MRPTGSRWCVGYRGVPRTSSTVDPQICPTEAWRGVRSPQLRRASHERDRVPDGADEEKRAPAIAKARQLVDDARHADEQACRDQDTDGHEGDRAQRRSGNANEKIGRAPQGREQDQQQNVQPCHDERSLSRKTGRRFSRRGGNRAVPQARIRRQSCGEFAEHSPRRNSRQSQRKVSA